MLVVLTLFATHMAIWQFVLVHQDILAILILNVQAVSYKSFLLFYNLLKECLLIQINFSLVPKIPVLPPSPECTRDTDCFSQRRCINQVCVNPCLAGEPCGRGAFCRVHDHNPVCICPIGYEGDPFVECRPRKYLFQFFYFDN